MLLIAMSQQAIAGGEIQPRGARSVGLGNSSIVLQDIWSAFNNQAGLVQIDGLAAGGYYRNLFFVEGLSDQGLVVAYGTGKNAFALDVSNFGIDQFSESKIGLAYAMDLGEKLDMGVQLNYHSTRIGREEEFKRNALTAEVSLLAQLTKGLQLGFKVFNPSQTKLSEDDDERIPTVMTIGGGYTFNDKVSLVSEVVKDIDLPAIVRAGIEYKVVPTFCLRGGVSTEPTLSSFGAGFILGQETNLISFYIERNHWIVCGLTTEVHLSNSPFNLYDIGVLRTQFRLAIAIREISISRIDIHHQLIRLCTLGKQLVNSSHYMVVDNLLFIGSVPISRTFGSLIGFYQRNGNKLD